jgi:hypothetical protein
VRERIVPFSFLNGVTLFAVWYVEWSHFIICLVVE